MLYRFFTSQEILEGSEAPARSSQAFMRAVTKGKRYKRRPEIPEVFWELITKCWDQGPLIRPKFQEIMDDMLACDDYTFPGTDLEKYHEYRERMRPREEDPIAEAEIASARSEGLLMSGLASGNRLLSDERRKSIRKSMILRQNERESDSNQALRRYDFTRSSLRMG
jgi:hypothetical protein